MAVAFGRLLGVGRERLKHCNCNSGPMSCLNLCGNQNLTARPPRHRRDACSMAWRCRFPVAQRGQHGRIIMRKPAPDTLVDLHRFERVYLFRSIAVSQWRPSARSGRT